MTAAAMLLVVVFGTLKVIVATASFTILLYYSIANLAALRMRPEDRLYLNWVPVLGLNSCLLLAAILQPSVIISGLALLVVGFILRWLFRRWAGSPDEQPHSSTPVK